MKINFPKRKNSFKNKKSEINPNVFWNYVLYITFGLTLASFAFGFYVFWDVNKKSSLVTDEPIEQIGTVRKERLDRVLEYFANKKMKSIEILNFPSGVVDPSL